MPYPTTKEQLLVRFHKIVVMAIHEWLQSESNAEYQAEQHGRDQGYQNAEARRCEAESLAEFFREDYERGQARKIEGNEYDECDDLVCREWQFCN